MTDPAVVRDLRSLEAALEQYATAHDRFAESEQVHRLSGHAIEAEGARRMAELCRRAWQAEAQDKARG